MCVYVHLHNPSPPSLPSFASECTESSRKSQKHRMHISRRNSFCFYSPSEHLLQCIFNAPFAGVWPTLWGTLV